MKKILCVHSSSDLYGADRIFELAVDILSSKYEVDVILPSQGALNSLLSKKSNVNVSRNLPVIVRSALGVSNVLKLLVDFFTFSFTRFFEAFKYNAIYVNTLSAALTLPAFYLARKCIILHVHEIVSEHGFLGRFLINFSVFLSDHVICVSDAVKADIEDGLFSFYRRLGAKKLSVIKNGIPDVSFDINKRVESEKMKFLLLGRLMPEKGQWFLLDALELLPDDILNEITVSIVGSPPPNREYLLEELKEKIVSLQLESVITLHAFVTNPLDLINCSHVMLVPSKMRDPFPTTVLEGLRAGKPVISTSHGGASEVIINDYNGFLVDHSNPGSLAEAIEKMYRIWSGKKYYEGMMFNSRNSYLSSYRYEIFSSNLKGFFLDKL
ncbi:glycosyl transferase family 1 [Oceanisphaera marina]|uniref:Glycosyl transferase family 1 n=1 Tax=Oceanisphaera marina TaxID=2017550 RepID=A0ABQ1ISP5_9GAMM|nr:glycosyltransferase [Oceanisphaera marina]GGB50284.1 glycosyl transferase family 1 [Oceanisphaera marina]